MREKLILLLSAEEINECQVATILFKFFPFLYIEWVKITQFVHLLQVAWVIPREVSYIPLSLCCCTVFQGSTDGSSEDLWQEYLHCLEFKEVALSCLKAYIWYELWLIRVIWSNAMTWGKNNNFLSNPWLYRGGNWLTDSSIYIMCIRTLHKYANSIFYPFSVIKGDSVAQ